MPADDPHEFDRLRHSLYTAVIADVLDSLGISNRAVSTTLLHRSGHDVLVGRAKTTAWEEVDQPDPQPYELELRAVDEVRPGEVLVAAAGGSRRSGIWGELLSTAAQKRGCAGALVDGAVRDVAKMQRINFTVFAAATCPLDSRDRQRVKAVDVPVEIGGVTIEPGDLVFADVDGVVVVPRAAEAEVLAKAWEKATAENRVRDEIRAGASATEVFRKYGVL